VLAEAERDMGHSRMAGNLTNNVPRGSHVSLIFLIGNSRFLDAIEDGVSYARRVALQLVQQRGHLHLVTRLTPRTGAVSGGRVSSEPLPRAVSSDNDEGAGEKR
jgi:hypothetical protein